MVTRSRITNQALFIRVTLSPFMMVISLSSLLLPTRPQLDGEIVAADIGKNADVVGTGGSTTTGVSTMELSNATIANTAALNLKIVGLYDVPGNAFGDYAVVVVKINEHLYGSAGVAGQGA
jgi:hypothetical protein